MTFKPVPHRGGWILLGLSALLLILALWFSAIAAARPLSASLFWWSLTALICLGLGLYLLYRAIALFMLGYHIDRNGLKILAGPLTYCIPMRDIEAVVPIESTSADTSGLPGRLPAWWLWGLGARRNFAPADTQQTLMVQTAQVSWLIAPLRRHEFVRAWELRRPLGPTQVWPARVERWFFFNWDLWFDDLTWRLAGGAFALNLVVLGGALSAYPSWPAQFLVNVNAFAATLPLTREQLLWLPLGASLVLLINLLLGAYWYFRDVMLAYTLWSLALLIQVGAWIGLRLIAG